MDEDKLLQIDFLLKAVETHKFGSLTKLNKPVPLVIVMKTSWVHNI